MLSPLLGRKSPGLAGLGSPLAGIGGAARGPGEAGSGGGRGAQGRAASGLKKGQSRPQSTAREARAMAFDTGNRSGQAWGLRGLQRGEPGPVGGHRAGAGGRVHEHVCRSRAPGRPGPPRTSAAWGEKQAHPTYSLDPVTSLDCQLLK